MNYDKWLEEGSGYDDNDYDDNDLEIELNRKNEFYKKIQKICCEYKDLFDKDTYEFNIDDYLSISIDNLDLIEDDKFIFDYVYEYEKKHKI